MQLEQNKYYHLYNRTNNQELLFKSRDNYLYFLTKYRKYTETDLDTLAYCLMPTHFHFMIYVKTDDVVSLKKKLGILLSSYTKAINRSYSRTGSLFQQHTKSKSLDTEKYFLTVINYIHQNPLRKKLISNLEDWEFSSYRDYAELRDGTLVKKDYLKSRFGSVEAFKLFSATKVERLKFIYDLNS